MEIPGCVAVRLCLSPMVWWSSPLEFMVGQNVGRVEDNDGSHVGTFGFDGGVIIVIVMILIMVK